ncbi:DNA-binding protein [Halorhabdus sp. CBA1104]|uniref:helix-turn-helix domain-containing protein n=1 Tax=Halorhabdus sp. CBA1104 TaxID=1380432 RepID=UPI0012B26F8C|nr:helix-turn-helix domain-containing protein [Halorhabdus sp. CBA1104]QGN06974.1 DNA-binding protein [Halorhabdus sp. CBA1104]
MGAGVRAALRVEASEHCPVARASATTGAVIETVDRIRSPDGRLVAEFTSSEPPATLPDAFQIVFESGSRRVYRAGHDPASACPSTVLDRHDCPPHDLVARDGWLQLVFHARSTDRVQSIVTALRDTFERVEILRLVRSHLDVTEEDFVVVDRAALTDRQRECLRTACRMGYFEYPRNANASEVATEMDISAATFVEHLAVAQGRLFQSILDP